MKPFLNTLFAAVLGVLIGQTDAKAAIINAPVPTSAFIVQGGLDWAWASPQPAPAGGFSLAFQGGLGWRLPTALELLTSPLATAFMFAGANVPLGGSDPVSLANFQLPNANLTGAAACATPYFSNTFKDCDWNHGRGQPRGPWAGMAGARPKADQLVVRVNAVPEPASLILLGTGLLGLGLIHRRRGA